MLNRALVFIAFLLPILSAFTGFEDYEALSAEIIQEEIEEEPDPNLVDLEDSAQDFVLETKQIFFEDYPDAFNPSIIRWKGRLLMCFRIYHPKTRATNEIMTVYLDENFNPCEAPRAVKFHSIDPYCFFKRQDPKLFAIGERLFIVYNNSVIDEVRRMVFAELFSDGNDFYVDHSECFIRFEGEISSRSEKNWVPFEYKGNLHFGYSLVPHKILRPLFGTSSCEQTALTLSAIKWYWGVLRGGTPALREGEEYLAFFHSSKSMSTKHSKGKSIPHYFMGAYTFSSEPPFAITRISPKPIIGKNFYHGKAHKTWKPLHVVFPGGFISDENHVWVVYGRQDHEIWVAKLDKNALLKSLKPVQLQ